MWKTVITTNVDCKLHLCLSDLEMAIAYWNLVLSGRFKFLDLWNKFLLVSILQDYSMCVCASSE